eukprot:CAMPEP_0205809842 /NCGR_PEP_ID=MMETSP0205-20121125/14067_1 /ASSEMBLY_ACC=CAM_ASM_000278 /TAXON_ID=36767 /ORGANISM="Euplotes focardii, Strain TN1" /LENGTH=252 /DNA_ID=CAMNT_0053087467 /DNA_START=290 /DNA_END=1046 /DNA_ORIENTATION=-
MNQVDEQMDRVAIGTRLKDQANTIGMVSKIAGRYISFYSDDLAELLLDDILEDTAIEMQNIEKQVKRSYMNDEQQILAQDIMNMMIDFDNEATVAVKKAEDTIDKIPAKKSQKLNPFGVKKLNKVKFEIENDDIDEVHDSTEAFRKGYTNPFTSAINKVIDEDDYDSDFEDDSKEESKKLGSKLKKKSSRNFMTEKDEFIHFDGKAAELEDEPSFKWKVKVPDYMQENIQKYRKEYEKFLVIHNNTSNKEVW